MKAIFSHGVFMFKRVLITGGTGFFGHAMTKKLLSENIAECVCIFSRDEFKQAQMRMKFNDDQRLRFFIGDVRDRERVKRAMSGCDLVIHAAALKRIETAHYNPEELVATNVDGTINVVGEAEKYGARCVFLSTDKACQPISAYGYSKAIAETIALGAGAAVTRYGNVAGSTGSVIPLWRSMGDVVKVTDPDCTRFWMYEHEAVDLVLEAARTMPKDVFIPELPAYRLGDLAEAMGKTMNVVGLPSWEKKHESMKPGSTSEQARRMSVDELREALKNV